MDKEKIKAAKIIQNNFRKKRIRSILNLQSFTRKCTTFLQ